MKDFSDRGASQKSSGLLDKIRRYGHKAGRLGHMARNAVFGLNGRPSETATRLPVKLLHRRRILQRRQVFHASGGRRSSIAEFALKRARQHTGGRSR